MRNAFNFRNRFDHAFSKALSTGKHAERSAGGDQENRGSSHNEEFRNLMGACRFPETL